MSRLSAEFVRDQIAEIDRDLRGGLIKSAVQRLREALRRPSGELDPFRLELSRLARRSGLNHIGIRLLRDRIRTGRSTSDERVEYALLLHRQGGHRAALRLIADINSKSSPTVLLVKAFASLALRLPNSAIEALRELVAIETRPYEKLVARTNLALALLEADQRAEFWELFAVLERDLDQAKSLRLLQHLDIMAVRARLTETSLEASAWAETRLLESAARVPIADRSIGEQLTFQFWQKMVQKRQAQLRSQELQLDFSALRLEAVKNEFWGLVVLIDQVKHSESRENAGPLSLLDLRHGTWEQKTGSVNQLTDRSYRILLALATSAGRPLRWSELFERAFPELNSDQDGAQQRLHQCLRRLRIELSLIECPVSLRARNGWYQLSAAEAVKIIVPGEPSSYLAHGIRRARWRLYKTEGVGPRMRHGLSASGIRRLTQEAVARGWEQQEILPRRDQELILGATLGDGTSRRAVCAAA